MPSPKKTNYIPVGTILGGKYRVTREIGRGGMASVHEAVNVDIGKKIAVKVLNPELTHSTIVVERFLREARAAAAVKSPHICDVYDAGRLQDGRPFLVLELLEGESLYERMVKVRRFDPEYVALAFTQVARGLAKAHEAQIVHRDLKPENIFITSGDDGGVLAKIVDFGLAKFYAPMDEDASVQRLTREGAVFGTPAYMSPEQVKGQGQVDHRADLWALGCMVYECLIGHTVWATDQGVAMIFAQIATAAVPVPSRERKDLTPEFDQWFAKALARDPAKRFQSAIELAEELAIALCQTPPPPSASGVFDREQLMALVSRPNKKHGTGTVDRTGDVVADRTAPDKIAPTKTASPNTASPNTGQAKTGTDRSTPANTDLDKRAPEPTQAPSPVASRSQTRPQHSQHATPSEPGDIAPPSKPWTVRPHTRAILLGALLGTVIAGLGGFLVVRKLSRTEPGPVAASAEPLSTSPPPEQSAKTPAVVLPPRNTDLPDWALQIADGQELLTKGDVNGATEALRTAKSLTTSGVPQTMLDHLTAASKPEGACSLKSLGRPRPFSLVKATSRPEVFVGTHGPLVAWSDDQENPGQRSAYVQLVDDSMRSLGNRINVTPEAEFVAPHKLVASGEFALFLFSDQHKSKPGVYVRRLRTTGGIQDASVRITSDRNTVVSPSIARTAEGDFWVAYVEDSKKSLSSKLYIQALTREAEINGAPLFVAELAARTGQYRSKTSAVSIASAPGALLLAYRRERGNDHTVLLQRIALDGGRTLTGLGVEEPPKQDRQIGETRDLSEGDGRLFPPSIECGGTDCFAVWRVEPKGAFAARVDPSNGATIWRNRFAPRGMQVAVSVDGTGSGLLVWYQDEKVTAAPITRDGIGTPSAIGRVKGEQPAPSVAKGSKPGEWLVAWPDYEAGHLEVFVASVTCR
ncbi:MAG: protein kinase [Polyangiaceae bacterium]|nr:protein kinase [Polyangiaceae bacterium]